MDLTKGEPKAGTHDDGDDAGEEGAEPVYLGEEGSGPQRLTEEQIEEITHLLRAGRRLPPHLNCPGFDGG